MGINETIIYSDKYEELYFRFLSHYDRVWDAKTYKSESSKLKLVLKTLRVSGLSGMHFYDALKKQGYKPYTIKAVFESASRMYEHGQHENIVSSFNNPFKEFLFRQKNLFRYAYKTERLKIDYDDTKKLLETIQDENLREFCLALLQSGLRIDEAYKVDHSTSSVVGKGGKQRFVNFKYNRPNPPSEYAVRKQLTALGLKPHTLRKLVATKLSRSELSRTDIREYMGWSSDITADRYNQPLKEEKLKAKIEEIL